jgi:hypothetical protein
MSKKYKVFLIFLTILLVVAFMPLFGSLFKLIIESTGGKIGACTGMTIYCFNHPEYFEGFFISYSFFVTVALTIFGGKNKYRILAVLLLIIFLIQLGSLESLIVSIGAAVAAWLIAQAVLIVEKKIVKK